MEMIDAIKRDANLITKGSFSQPATFTSLSGQVATVRALHTKHHLGFDLERAQETNTLKAHIHVSEQELTAIGYTVRNDRREVDMIGHKVSTADANGAVWIYKVQQNFPNEKTGSISFILEDFVQ